MIDLFRIDTLNALSLTNDGSTAMQGGEQDGKRKLRWSREAETIGLEITYPLKLKYGFINQLLHHLVSTINKSPLISFLLKVDFQSNAPFLLTFYHTIFLPLVKPNFCEEKKPITGNIFILPDLIYGKILLLCEQYTIRHSPYPKAYELIQELSELSQQILQFIEKAQAMAEQIQQQGACLHNLEEEFSDCSLCTQEH